MWTNSRGEYGPVGERGLDIWTNRKEEHGPIGDKGLDIWTTVEEALTSRIEGIRYFSQLEGGMDQ